MKKVLKFLMYGVIALILLGLFFGDNDKTPANEPQQAAATNNELKSAETSNPQPQKTPSKDYIANSGTHKVGTDIPAGEYMIISDSMAYYELKKDSSGSLESILSNDNFSFNRYLEVRDGEYLKLQNCKLYALDKAPDLAEMGMYKIGVDLPPGEYKLSAEGMGYYEVTKSARGNILDIVTNDNFEGDTYVTVKSGQYLKLNGAYLKK